MLRIALKAILLILLLTLPIFATVDAHGGSGEEEKTVVAEENHNTPVWPVTVSLGLAFVLTGGTWIIKRDKFTEVQYGTIGLMIGTGLIHLILGLRGETLLILNGLGYAGLIGLRFLPILKQQSRILFLDWGILVYTAVTIIGFFVLHDTSDTVGLMTKGLEVILMLFVFVGILNGNNQATKLR